MGATSVARGLRSEADTSAASTSPLPHPDPVPVARHLQIPAPHTLADLIAHRRRHLTDYQNSALADRYQTLVDRVHAAEQKIHPGSDELANAVAWNYAKLLAYKDEYEVARLYTDGRFAEDIADRFEGNFKLHFHLAPPLVAQRDATTGHLKKREFGPGMIWAFRLHFIVIYRLDAWEAMEMSRKVATKNLVSLIGLFFLLGIIIIISALPCGIGLLFSMPLMIGALYSAFAQITGCDREDDVELDFKGPNTL